MEGLQALEALHAVNDVIGVLAASVGSMTIDSGTIAWTTPTSPDHQRRPAPGPPPAGPEPVR